jgi:hypothetical protein
VSDYEPEIVDQDAYNDCYQVKGPHWADGCNHGSAEYVGTVAPIVRKRITRPGRPISFQLEIMVLDVYVFDQPSGQSLCLRFGDEPSEYYSPGDLVSFIRSAGHMDEYEAALKLLLRSGQITWMKD